jgi:cytochrome b subunit of formate dehydrogenase
VHVTGAGEPAALAFIRQFYLLLIPVTIGLMMLHNGGDWIRKLVRARFRTGAQQSSSHAPAGLRMLPFERVQHAVLALSFITLAWTGFALKYPDQWWARPLLLLEIRHDMRSLIHRVAASVFIAVSVTHVVSLIVSRKLRGHWKEMIPKVRDAREASNNFAYNLGLGDAPPPRSSHSYIEKAEYWAVIWGAVIMTASGVMLWANSLALRLLPKLWLDVATSVHFYEAVLAALAIVVWHFYSIIFDPDIYPLNTAFLTGYSVKKDDPRGTAEAHEHDAHPREAPGD